MIYKEILKPRGPLNLRKSGHSFCEVRTNSPRKPNEVGREANSSKSRSRNNSSSEKDSRSDKSASIRPQNSGSQKLTSGSYSSYKTAEDRAAFIKQQAEQRMAERLAALGLKAPVKSGNSSQERQERERKEKEERLRKAEEEDARREQERQKRLAEDNMIPEPRSIQKKPPPPPSRKGKADIAQHDKRQAVAETKRVEQEIAETALKEQQKAQVAETRNLQ